MASNVTGNASHGWAQMIDGGVATGWVYRWTLKLECGHEQEHLSPVFSNRNQNVAPPAWVTCKQCEREGR
jgi:hypothetical protein